MAQTLVSLLTHIVFSTKRRVELITPDIEPNLYAYLGGIAKAHHSKLLAAGGTANHVHLLISQSKNIALSDLLAELKRDSSKWIKTQDASLSDFHWQDGYGAFSIGTSQIPAVRKYLAQQKQHHQKRSFKEEFIELLERYGIDYREEYLWD